jgi:hypothetical protein
MPWTSCVTIVKASATTAWKVRVRSRPKVIGHEISTEVNTKAIDKITIARSKVGLSPVLET